MGNPKLKINPSCQFVNRRFHHFLLMPKCPTPLLGRDLLSRLLTIMQFGEPQGKMIAVNIYFLSSVPAFAQIKERPPILRHIAAQVDPSVYRVLKSLVELLTYPVNVKLKHTSYPLRPEAQWDLKPDSQISKIRATITLSIPM